MNRLKVRVGNNGIQQCHVLSLSRRYFTFFVDVLWSPHDSASYTVLHATYKINVLTISSLYCFSLGLNFAC